MSKSILLHTINGEKSNQLIESLKSNGNTVDIATDEFAEQIKEQEILIIAFPDLVEDTNTITSTILTRTFQVVQKFVQVRMRKKSGQVLFLIPAQANGMSYPIENKNTLYNVAQGGFTGFAKTIVKEYGKKGLNANAIYIDWENTDMTQIANLANANLDQMKGQTIAIDGGIYV